MERNAPAQTAERRGVLRLAVVWLLAAGGLGLVLTHQLSRPSAGSPPAPPADLAERLPASPAVRVEPPPAPEPAPAAPETPPDHRVGQPLAGPYPTLSALCQQLQLGCEGHPDLGQGPGRLRRRGPWPAPFTEVRFFSGAMADEDSLAMCHLLLRTDRGWFVLSDLALCDNKGTQRIDEVSITQEQAIPRRGTATPLVLTLTEQSHHHVDGYSLSRSLILCGVGPSATPSCTDGVSTFHEEGPIGDETDRGVWRVQARFKVEGHRVTLRRPGRVSRPARERAAEMGQRAGSWTVAFP